MSLFVRLELENYASHSKTKYIAGISAYENWFSREIRQLMVVINGFNGNPRFSTFWPEMLYVCSYLLIKPNDRYLASEFLH